MPGLGLRRPGRAARMCVHQATYTSGAAPKRTRELGKGGGEQPSDSARRALSWGPRHPPAPRFSHVDRRWEPQGHGMCW